MVISEGTCILRGVSSEGLPGLSQHHVCALTSCVAVLRFLALCLCCSRSDISDSSQRCEFPRALRNERSLCAGGLMEKYVQTGGRLLFVWTSIISGSLTEQPRRFTLPHCI